MIADNTCQCTSSKPYTGSFPAVLILPQNVFAGRKGIKLHFLTLCVHIFFIGILPEHDIFFTFPFIDKAKT